MITEQEATSQRQAYKCLFEQFEIKELKRD